MKEKSASGILGTSVEKMRELVDVSTIIGQPIQLGGVTVVPVSKVSYGFASGGSDFPSKNNQELFGGGGGAGVTISPVAFLVVKGGEVQVKYVTGSETAAERLIGAVPDLVTKLTDTVDKLMNKSKGETDPVEDAIAEAKTNL
ncbi:MAG: sporulation protein YtfJ [Oscillospiraceae bacterium]|jgi:sporulation protein YtfJ|nr:sporulation protein YtfJ [Oscillospiraceae bacterium]